MYASLLGCVAVFAHRVTAQKPSEETGVAAALQKEANDATTDFNNWLFYICGALVVTVAGYKILLESVKYVRTLACLTSDTQRYFSLPSESYAFFKKHMMYAPVFRKRHNREFQLSSAVNIGTLPTRLQLLFLVLYLSTNVAFCVVSIHWSQDFGTVANELRNRTGVLAIVNMVPLFVLAARNNPLIQVLAISFDTFNLLHRWFGRIVVLESTVHAGAWIAGQVKSKGWVGVTATFKNSQMIMFGLIVSIP
jgi:hypothetical protein